ncbi:MAG TPA: transketolase C-terminal domain-containing protein [Gemmatimonadales bacterium]|nr:transketolase C-terminal domain-containing protein [Gemmatimonadales bacterium]
MGVTGYGLAIREGFEYLLANHREVFTIGQGLWSPWYVGNSMTDLDHRFGRERVIDTPVSELATTGAALGAALCGYRPVVIHPRVDFMLLAVDQIVTQAAKWRHMFGGSVRVPLTVRGIINRGGEQGAQHSQSLHSWFAHVPGLRVVMPATPADARDLLIASVLCDDPVLYIDDRWLYGVESELSPPVEMDLRRESPRRVREGRDITLAGAGYSAWLCVEAARVLAEDGISCDVIDIRVLNPLDARPIVDSVRRTGRLLAVDGDWLTCGFAGEIVARAAEAMAPSAWRASPRRLTLPDAPAPTSGPLEKLYYPTVNDVVAAARQVVGARADTWE